MKTYRLVIKRQSGSEYWREHFNSIPELQTWLDEEKTRPYWDASYITETYEVDNQGIATMVD